MFDGVVGKTEKRWGCQRVTLEECPWDVPDGGETERVAVRVTRRVIGEMDAGDHVTVEGLLQKEEDESIFIEAATVSVIEVDDDEEITVEKIRERLGWE